MLNNGSMDKILHQLKSGEIGVEEAKKSLRSYEDFGFFKWDTHREKRQGFPEVVYGEGKTAGEIKEILGIMKKKTRRLLVTRVNVEKAAVILNEFPDMTYHARGKIVYWLHPDEPQFLYDGYVSIVSAGTSDLQVADEAALTVEVMGCPVKRFTDVGVAGIHRLFDQIEDIRKGSVSIVVAGMEGALPSVVGGLVSHPIIAIPTSVGYGANFNGLSALLTMLNSCASGISVVNIDNGFGGGYNAALIHRLAKKEVT